MTARVHDLPQAARGSEPPVDTAQPESVLTRVQTVHAARRRVHALRRALLSLAVLLGSLIIAHAVMIAADGRVSWSLAAGASLLLALLTFLRLPRFSAPLVNSALWLEEGVAGTTQRTPDFALVTATELLESGEAVPPGLALAAAASLREAPVAASLQALRARAWRGPALFVALCTVSLAFTLWWPRTATRDTAVSDTRNPPTSEGAAASVVPLGSWRVRVQPPSYTTLPARSVGDVGSVIALSGSVVDVRGDGGTPEASVRTVSADSTSGDHTARTLAVTSDSAGWSLRVVAGTSPVAVRVSRGGRDRLLVIEGHADSVPRVSLDAPARDSVFREARGSLPLVATVQDDIGLSRAQFELLVSSGEGERFTVRTVLQGEQRWSAGTRTTRAVLRGTLDLTALKLQAGDVVHVRAVARDAHPSAAREFGSSETRAFRIARPAEYDSVAVEPAPPPEVDKSLLSQRMLLMLTQKLDKAQARLPRAEVLRESVKLARDQARLRLAVGDVVFQRLSGESSAEHAHYAGDGHDHGVDQQGGKLSLSTNSTSGMLEEGNDSPVIAINQPLLEAYNAMWDAGRALEQGDPRGAIPPMLRALEAIERSRAASRLYLRGRPPQVIVDIAKVRLVGKDTGQVTLRSERPSLPRVAAARDARLVRAAQLAVIDAAAARDSLALLRAESLADAPAFAEALARAAERLTRDGDATQAFVDARRVLGIVSRTSVSTWSRGGTP